MKKIFLIALISCLMILTACGTPKVASDTKDIAKDAVEVMEMYDDNKMSADEARERLDALYEKADDLKLEDSTQDSNNTSVMVDVNSAQIKILANETCIDEIKNLKEVINK